MTVRSFAAVCWRRGVILLLGLVATVAAVTLAKPQTVFWSRVTATVVTPPPQAAQPGGLQINTLENQPPEAVSVAALLAVRVNGGIPERRSASPDATLYGEGYTRAVSARVRNTGGQWTNQVSDPVIDVEVVDVTGEAVGSRIEAEGQKLVSELNGLQDDLKVSPTQRIVLRFSPTTPRVEAITSSRMRAALAFNVFGAATTLTLVYYLDRFLLRRRKVRVS